MMNWEMSKEEYELTTAILEKEIRSMFVEMEMALCDRKKITDEQYAKLDALLMIKESHERRLWKANLVLGANQQIPVKT